MKIAPETKDVGRIVHKTVVIEQQEVIMDTILSQLQVLMKNWALENRDNIKNSYASASGSRVETKKFDNNDKEENTNFHINIEVKVTSRLPKTKTKL